MAKRTNKTDHVLNLLAGATKPEDADNKAKPPVDPLEKMNSNVSVHHTSTNGDAPIADAVKESLERELLGNDESVVSSGKTQTKAAKTKADLEEASVAKADPEETATPKTVPEEVSAETSAAEVVPEQVAAAEAAPAKEPAQNVTSTGATAQGVQEEVASMAASAEGKGETMQDTVSEEKDAMTQQEAAKEEPVKEEAAKPEAPAERTFEFVNVMEHLVRDQVKRYMEQFGNCMCERCVEDVTALSLSHLPAKCVVVNKEAVSPLLNFYTKKYAGQITVEITKACIVVQENPNH